MSESALKVISQCAQVESAPGNHNHVEVWDEVSLFDDSSLVAVHEGAVGDLLAEYVRTDADQSARDGLAARALGLIVSAVESPFSDEGRRLALVNQLVSQIGALCDHNHLQSVLDKHMPESASRDKTDADLEADDGEEKRTFLPGKNFLPFAKRAGGLALKPFLAGLRKLLVPFRSEA